MFELTEPLCYSFAVANALRIVAAWVSWTHGRMPPTAPLASCGAHRGAPEALGSLIILLDPFFWGSVCLPCPLKTQNVVILCGFSRFSRREAGWESLAAAERLLSLFEQRERDIYIYIYIYIYIFFFFLFKSFCV